MRKPMPSIFRKERIQVYCVHRSEAPKHHRYHTLDQSTIVSRVHWIKTKHTHNTTPNNNKTPVLNEGPTSERFKSQLPTCIEYQFCGNIEKFAHRWCHAIFLWWTTQRERECVLCDENNKKTHKALRLQPITACIFIAHYTFTAIVCLCSSLCVCVWAHCVCKNPITCMVCCGMLIWQCSSAEERKPIAENVQNWKMHIHTQFTYVAAAERQ